MTRTLELLASALMVWGMTTAVSLLALLEGVGLETLHGCVLAVMLGLIAAIMWCVGDEVVS